MTEYEPTARRPIAELFRRTARSVVTICVRWRIHPDAISYSSIAASLAAAICFWRSGTEPWLLVPAALLCYLRLWLNMLDGMVAVAADRASLRGELLNELPDRLSDALIFAGVAHSGLCAVPGGYWAAIASLLTAYVGIFGQALGGRRQFGGLMAKPWRMVALHLGSWLTLGLILSGRGTTAFLGLTVLDWTHLVIVAGCVQTLAVRLAAILADLARRS